WPAYRLQWRSVTRCAPCSAPLRAARSSVPPSARRSASACGDRRSAPPAPPRRHRAVDLPALHPLADRRALVVELLPDAESQLRLRPPARPVEPQRHERQAPLLDPAPQALDLLAMQQQLAVPLRVVSELARRCIRADVCADEEELVAEEARVRILQVRPMIAQRLDLAADERQARLEALADRVVVEGPPVDGDVALAGLLGHPAALIGTSARFSRIRFRSSTNTTFGSCARAAASSIQVNAAMITRSPGRTRCAAAPFTQTTPLSGGPSTA